MTDNIEVHPPWRAGAISEDPSSLPHPLGGCVILCATRKSCAVAVGGVGVSGCITVVHVQSLRSVGLDFDIQIDGTTIGRLKRGESLTQDVVPGEHTVQAFFAHPLGDPGFNTHKHSWAFDVDLQDGETVVLNTALGSATVPIAQHGMLPENPYATEQDWVLLTLQGYYDAAHPLPDQGPRFPAEAIARLMLTIVIIAGLATSLVPQLGTPLHTGSQVIIGIAVLALTILLYRHARSTR